MYASSSLLSLAGVHTAYLCPACISLPEMAAGLQGNINVINAAIKKGVKKFVLVTSLGCGDSKDSIPAKVSVENTGQMNKSGKAKFVLGGPTRQFHQLCQASR